MIFGHANAMENSRLRQQLVTASLVTTFEAKEMAFRALIGAENATGAANISSSIGLVITLNAFVFVC